ncbi:hypothetical protein Tco_1160489, partial [Tanacetum coccineum]
LGRYLEEIQMVETASGMLVTPSGSASDRVREIVMASEL